MKKIIFALLILLSSTLAQKSYADASCISVKIPVEVEEAFYTAAQDIPCEMIASLKTIEIFEDDSLPRAMANARILKINKNVLDDPELVSVLIHELGHVVDLGGLHSQKYVSPSLFKDGSETIYEDDISTQFYAISWANENSRKQNATVQDFAGEYASSDPFEDFAEAFLLYINHGNTFRKMARHNDAMAQKYAFIKEKVFQGTEFNTGTRKISADKRVWDITKL